MEQSPTGNPSFPEAFLFQFIVSGSADFVYQGTRHHVSQGEAFLSCSPSSWECIPSSSGYRSLVYLMRGEGALSLGGQLLEQYGAVIAVAQGSKSLEMLEAHYRKLRCSESLDMLEESLFGYRFLLSLYREVAPATSSAPVPAFAPVKEEKPAAGIPENLRRATDYVEEHLADTLLNVETIAKVAGFSKYHFIRTFEKAFGMSPWKYLLARRLFHAAQLLAQDKSLPIKAIIQQCGFTSETYFCRVFRKTYQRSPGSHRRLMSIDIPTTL